LSGAGKDSPLGTNPVEVFLDGDVDIASADEIEARIRSAEAEEPSVILVDLRQVSFLDSSGLRLILGAAVRAQAAGRRLVLVRGPERVQRVFELTNLQSRLEFVDHPSLLAHPSPKG
jgi:anti-anti-sigma factor